MQTQENSEIVGGQLPVEPVMNLSKPKFVDPSIVDYGKVAEMTAATLTTDGQGNPI